MDPELIDLMRSAQVALDNGRSRTEVDSIIKVATGNRIPSTAALADTLNARLDEAQSEPAQSREKRSPKQTINDVVRLGAHGFMGGLLSEAAGLLAGAGAAIVPGGKGFSEARAEETARSRAATEEARGRQGLLGVVPQVAGAIVGGPGRVGAAMLRQGGRLVSRAGGTAARGAARAGVGAGVAGFEGGLLGFGEAEGDLRDRLSAARDAAAISAVTGGVAGAAGPAIGRVLRSTVKPKAGAGRVSRTLDDVVEAVGEESKGFLAGRRFDVLRSSLRKTDVEEKIARLTAEAGDEAAVRNGMLQRIAAGLDEQAVSVEQLRRSLSKLRVLLPDDGFTEVARAISEEASAASVARLIRKWAPRIAGAGVALEIGRDLASAGGN